MQFFENMTCSALTQPSLYPFTSYILCKGRVLADNLVHFLR